MSRKAAQIAFLWLGVGQGVGMEDDIQKRALKPSVCLDNGEKESQSEGLTKDVEAKAYWLEVIMNGVYGQLVRLGSFLFHNGFLL